MKIQELILIAAIPVLMFFVAIFLKKNIKPKPRFIISVISFVILLYLFTKNLVAHFSYLWLIILCLFFVFFLVDLYKRYKELRKSS